MSSKNIIYKAKLPYTNQEATIIWHDLVDKKIPNKNWRQVHAIANYKDRIVLVYFPHLDMIHIPGGHIEVGESIEDTLSREVKEETGGDIIGWEPIGYQERIDVNGNIDYQLRVYAQIRGIKPKNKDYDGKMVFTRLVAPKDFLKVWGWDNPIGERIQERVNDIMKVQDLTKNQ